MVQLTALQAQHSAEASRSISTLEGGCYQIIMKGSLNSLHFPSEYSVPVPMTQGPPCSLHLLKLPPWTPCITTLGTKLATHRSLRHARYPNLNSHFLLYPSEVFCSLFPATSNNITDGGVTGSPGKKMTQNVIPLAIVPARGHVSLSV